MITSHSSSVTSVWYRLVSRICCFRVVGVHMATPRLVSATPWNHIRLQPLNPLRNGFLDRRIKFLELLQIILYVDALYLLTFATVEIPIVYFDYLLHVPAGD